MTHAVLLDAIDDGAGKLSLATERSAVTVTHVRHDAAVGGTLMSLEPQDAQLLVYQLGDHPAHDVWLGDKHLAIPAMRSGQLNLVDVREAASARTQGALDSLHILLPQQAVQDLSPTSDGRRCERLHAPAGWMTRDDRITQLAPMLTQALHAGNLSKLYVEHLIWGVVTHLAQAYGAQAERPTGGLAPWQVKRAQAMMDEGLGAATLIEIAGACGLSLAHFSRGFKQSTGLAPHAWLQSRRMEKARSMLMHKGPSIPEVAQACGFGDHSHFSRIFRRDVGAAPATWRRLHQTAYPTSRGHR